MVVIIYELFKQVQRKSPSYTCLCGDRLIKSWVNGDFGQSTVTLKNFCTKKFTIENKLGSSTSYTFKLVL